MEEVVDISFRFLSPHLYDFLEALITQQTSPDEAYRKFDAIASKQTEQLRKFTKQVKCAELSRKNHIMTFLFVGFVELIFLSE